MNANPVSLITTEIINLQGREHCWNTLPSSDKNYPDLKHYSPIYKSTLWVLILLADIQADPRNTKLLKPLSILSKELFNPDHGIFTIGKSHFPIPCLNGNMLYLLNYFNADNRNQTESIIEFFSEYQRFDDGDFKTPPGFPYFSNKSCYGKHTCYWGVAKLLKGLSFIPLNKRSEKATKLLKKCIEFILLHDISFSSHNKKQYLHPNIGKLTFPNMFQSDFLEILWLLKRENIVSGNIKPAIKLLKSKKKTDNTWNQERIIKNLIIPINNKKYGREFITMRARDVLEFYSDRL